MHHAMRDEPILDEAAAPHPSAARQPPVPDAGEQPGPADRAALFSVLTGGWIAQACYALAKLGVPDLLADGPRGVEELAADCAADVRALHRTLGALAAVGLLRRTAPRTYALTGATRLLCSTTRDSAGPTAVMFGEEVHRAFGDVLHTLRTGSPAFPHTHGASFYDYLADHPEAAATFNTAMGSTDVPTALARCDLSRLGTLVDVGGGEGRLLAAVLKRRPGARGVLVELPETLVNARKRLADAGCAQRVDFVAGSFFDAGVVPAGGDIYTLSRVLHNWDDSEALTILRAVRGAIGPDGRLLVLERLEELDEADPGRPPGRREAQAKLIDLLMLVMVEGYDRTLEQYRALLGEAGFAVRAVHRAPLHAAGAECAIEAVPAPPG